MLCVERLPLICVIRRGGLLVILFGFVQLCIVSNLFVCYTNYNTYIKQTESRALIYLHKENSKRRYEIKYKISKLILLDAFIWRIFANFLYQSRLHRPIKISGIENKILFVKCRKEIRFLPNSDVHWRVFQCFWPPNFRKTHYKRQIKRILKI